MVLELKGIKHADATLLDNLKNKNFPLCFVFLFTFLMVLIMPSNLLTKIFTPRTQRCQPDLDFAKSPSLA